MFVSEGPVSSLVEHVTLPDGHARCAMEVREYRDAVGRVRGEYRISDGGQASGLGGIQVNGCQRRDRQERAPNREDALEPRGWTCISVLAGIQPGPYVCRHRQVWRARARASFSEGLLAAVIAMSVWLFMTRTERANAAIVPRC
jgi:hypothetical protein